MTFVVPRHNLRASVTTWYTVALCAALAAHAAIVYVSLRWVLWEDLDDRLHHEIGIVEGLLQPPGTTDGAQRPDGISPLEDDDYRWLQVWTPDGRLVFQSDTARTAPLQLPPPRSNASMSLTLPAGQHVRVREELGHMATGPVFVRLATSEARVREALAEMVALLVIACPLCALAAADGGYRLVRGPLESIDRLVRAANGITVENLAARLPVENPVDEVGQLAQAFNATLARLETSFAEMRRFTANAAHELRTPLTALRSTGQAALTDAESLSDHREAIGGMLEEATRLSQLLDTLLLLARSDSGEIVLTRRVVSLLALVQEVAADCRVLAEERGQIISIDGTAVLLSGDPTVLRIAVANVIHNAIRYGPPQGHVKIRVLTRASAAVVEVEDEGEGIPSGLRDRIFERFYRVDSARGRDAGGAGLGLAMARWAIQAHQGTIRVRNNDRAGSTFSLVLPLPASSPKPEHSDS